MNLYDYQTSDALAAAAAHMRGALCNLKIAASRLASEEAREASPELDQSAAVLDQSYYQLLRFINNLSDAAYLSGTKDLHRRACDLAELASDFCVGVADLVEDKGIHLSYTLPADQYFCYVDPDAIRKVLYQLLSNALKFTPSGGSIRVALRVMEEQVLLTVSDTGCGIPDDRKETLLTRYLQTEKPAGPLHGFGLGLPLCKCIAEAHGGRLFWQSEEGRGSQFFISIPAGMPEENAKVIRDLPFDATGGYNAVLLGLADALDASAFRIRCQ